MNLVQMLDMNARKFGPKASIRYGGKVIKYQLREQSQ
jgi:hypothetical protein